MTKTQERNRYQVHRRGSLLEFEHQRQGLAGRLALRPRSFPLVLLGYRRRSAVRPEATIT